MSRNNSRNQGANEVFILQDITNPEMGFHNIMNKYENKRGEQAIFHNNKETFVDGSGTEWRLASKIIRVPGSDIPTGGVKVEPQPEAEEVKPLVANPPAPAKTPIVVTATKKG